MSSVALNRGFLTSLVIVLSTAGFIWLTAPALSGRYVPKVVEFSIKDRGAKAQIASVSDYRSKVLKAGKRFNLVGISWAGTRQPRLFVRSRLGDDQWSGWQIVSTAYDHGPDGSGNKVPGDRVVSDPAWIGEADTIQWRTVGSARMQSVKLHFVNSTGSATGWQRARTGILRNAKSAVSSVAGLIGTSSVGAENGQPEIVPRADWGASQCNPKGVSYGNVKFAVVHHTVNSNDYSPDQSGSIVLAICRFHRDTRGWNDIGYNFLVDQYGKVFEGRAGGIDREVVGAHASGYNSNSFGVGNIGTFSTVPQSSLGINALARLIAWKLAIHGVPVLGTAQVGSKSFNNISGHRDVNSTSCPGNSLYDQLPELRTRADAAQRGINISPYSLSLQADPEQLEYGIRATLNGSLTEAATGMPLVYEKIRLDVSSSKKWRRFRTVTTDEKGTWSTTVGPRAKRSYRAAYIATDGSGTAYSKRLALVVQPKLGLKIAGGRRSGQAIKFKRGSLARVTASIEPKRRNLVLVVYRSRRNKFGRVLRKRFSVREGDKLKAYFRFKRAGKYKMRAYYMGDRHLTRGHFEINDIQVS